MDPVFFLFLFFMFGSGCLGQVLTFTLLVDLVQSWNFCNVYIFLILEPFRFLVTSVVAQFLDFYFQMEFLRSIRRSWWGFPEPGGVLTHDIPKTAATKLAIFMIKSSKKAPVITKS